MTIWLPTFKVRQAHISSNYLLRQQVLFTLVRYLYSLILFISLPLIFLRLLWRSRKLPAYRQRWAERLAIISLPEAVDRSIWLHAVSVGEVVAAIPLVKALQATYPDLSLVVTTTTPTGSQRLKQSFGNSVHHFYLPYDLSFCIQRAINKIKPSCLIIMETELWPNLLAVCYKNHIPILIANARLSDDSFKRYKKIKFLLAKMLSYVSFVAAQSQMDADRFISLGLAANKLAVTGNLKFDVKISDQHREQGLSLKQSFAKRLVWVAASTHPGEEEEILKIFEHIIEHHPDCLLILVPRHPDRFNAVAKIVEQHHLTYIRRSQNSECSPETKVLLGDTMGELNIFYVAADLAFVGGSLVNIGGHNLLEPAAAGVAAITGPFFSNFKEITHKLEQAGGVVVVQNSDQLSEIVIALLNDTNRLKQMGQNALNVVKQNQGTVVKIVQLLKEFN